MYSLNCEYYVKNFETLDELIDDVISSGMDPNYEITKNGKGTGEELIEFIVF
jgi:hypothetical protein